MLVKILSIIDILTAVLLYVFLNTGDFKPILLIFVVLIVLKSVFSLKNIFSYLDLGSAIIIVLAIYGLTGLLTWVAFGWLFVKGLFSLVSSV
jgi:hypothetical protein